MKRLNLSEWAITHQPLVLFMILLLGAAGVVLLLNLGRAEDPYFTIKAIVSAWPGPGRRRPRCGTKSPTRSRRNCRSCPTSIGSQSYSQPGVMASSGLPGDDTPPAEVTGLWYQARKKLGDMRRPARGRPRAACQRRIRRRLFRHLHADRRTGSTRPAQGRRRGYAPAAAARAGRQQGRSDRRPRTSGSTSSSATSSSRPSA